ncbi:DJ-1/PfpI family protein [Amycolatopsis xylanica]|uniref:DJ-1/PfpI family protein n=1 Tax=Amycolatopsis xylanica TaxID=589385 RepID=A0A1H3CEP5_9PSEU|nr:DJ-1/PfpI family protein [Amycolatopsis xylanica]SDX52368.1 DJ-1/PfpI family protein [Amycolatopsis xylanica]
MLAQFVLFNGFDPLDVIAPYEVLYAGGMEAEFVSAEGAREVPSAFGALSLTAVGRIDPRRADIVVVPGAAGELSGENSIPVILGRAVDTELPLLLKESLDQPDTLVATVCGGSMILAMAGLLGGRPATTNHLGLDTLASAGVRAIDARVVDDGDLVTAAGVTSGLDLGLYLLERELGAQVALAVEKLFSHERRGTVWREEVMPRS